MSEAESGVPFGRDLVPTVLRARHRIRLDRHRNGDCSSPTRRHINLALNPYAPPRDRHIPVMSATGVLQEYMVPKRMDASGAACTRHHSRSAAGLPVPGRQV